MPMADRYGMTGGTLQVKTARRCAPPRLPI